MNITTVVNIIRVDKHIDIFGIETLSETIEEVFDYKQGVCSSDICNKPLQRVQELNDMYKTPSRYYITSRID